MANSRCAIGHLMRRAKPVGVAGNVVDDEQDFTKP
jgi:hypothetical protein